MNSYWQIACASICLLGFIGCDKKTESENSGQGAGVPAAQPHSVKEQSEQVNVDTPADFTVGMDQFAREFDENREAAKKKYQGKVVEISGYVSSNYIQRTMGCVRTIISGDKKKSGSTYCDFSRTDPLGPSMLCLGQEIKFKARAARNWDNELHGCVLVSTEKSPLIRLPIADILKVATGDRNKAERFFGESDGSIDFSHKTLVEGVIKEITVEKDVHTFVVHDPKDDNACIPVEIQENPHDKETTRILNNFKVGDPIRANGDVWLYKGIGLRNAHLLD